MQKIPVSVLIAIVALCFTLTFLTLSGMSIVQGIAIIVIVSVIITLIIAISSYSPFF